MDMRVAGISNAYGIYSAKNVSGAKKTEAAGKTDGSKDTFTLSMKAEDYQTVKKALAEAPEIRIEKVAQIKARIEANAYHVSAADVAAKILKGLDG